MTLAAMPAMAQVPGIYGQAACAAGGSQSNHTVLTNSARPNVAATSATFTHSNVQGSYYHNQAGNTYPYTLYFAIRKADGTGGVSNNLIGTMMGDESTLPNRTLQTRTPLTANTKYQLAVHTDASAFNNTGWPAGNRIGARICFKTGPSAAQMSLPSNTPFPGGGTAGGCFAFGGTPEQVRACFCGARNTAGMWMPNADADGFSYLVDAATRTSFGCTTS